MTYNDVVSPAQTGNDIAKHGNKVVLVPGKTIRQILDTGYSEPVAAHESRLTNRFDDVEYYGAAAAAGGGTFDVGPLSGSVANSTLLSGDFGWSGFSNCFAADTQYCSAVVASFFGQGPDGLRIRDFTGFNIPLGATIVGITVEVLCYQTNGVIDANVRLQNTDTITNGSSKVLVVPLNTPGYVVLGGVADLWGGTWTPSLINASSFGIQLNASFSGNGGIFIDHVRISVRYTT